MRGQRTLVGVFSGLVFSGKSFFRNWVMNLPEYQNAVLVAMDDIRKNFWPDRSDAHITRSEHVFKNEATRFEIKKRLIVDRPPAIFSEMVMLTREAHQRPFTEMINDANQYLDAINNEEAQRDGKPTPGPTVKADFRCVYFYCDLEAVKRRVAYRLQEIEKFGNKSNTAVFDFDGFLRGAKQIEIPPVGYTPLYLNTSDESPPVLVRQRAEILSFLEGNMPINPDELKRREVEAVEILNQARCL